MVKHLMDKSKPEGRKFPPLRKGGLGGSGYDVIHPSLQANRMRCDYAA
jgi:hypothetical protein